MSEPQWSPPVDSSARPRGPARPGFATAIPGAPAAATPVPRPPASAPVAALSGQAARGAGQSAPSVPQRGLDVRLAIGAAAAWLAVLAALGAPAGRVLACGIGAALVGAVLVLAGRRGAPAVAAAALVAFCLALVLLPLAARLAQVRDSPLAQLARRHAAVTVELTVSSDPRILAARSPAGSPRVAVDARAVAVSVAGRTVQASGALLVLGPAEGWRDVLPGQRALVDGRLQPPLGSDLIAATLASQSAPVLVGRPPSWQRGAGAVRSALRRAAHGLPEPERGLLPGLIDGDTSNLDPVLAERFRIAGLTHLIAVSGTNCAVVVAATLLIARRFGAGPGLSASVGLAVLVGFVVVARPSPSVLRAGLMAAIALGALARGRQRDGVPMLAAAVLALLLWRPSLAADPGFAMSVLATGALLTIAPGWAAALRRYRVPRLLAEPLAVAAAAHLVTAPVIAAISGQVSLVAIPANMFAEPVVAVTTVLGFAAALTAPLCLSLGALLAQLAGYPCRWLVAVAEFFGSRHGATVPWPAGVLGGLELLGASSALLLLARRSGARRVLMSAAVVAVLVQLPVRALVGAWPPPGWVFVACDVGQGDALVLAAGGHSAVVVDAGPEPVAVDRCLGDLHITRVPLLMLTHYHLDHVAGLSGVFHGRRVTQVVTGPLAEPSSGVELVRSVLNAHGLTIGSALIGSQVDVGAVHVEVLAPPVAMHGTRSDPNNSSLVVRATVRGLRILLPGDVEIEAQQAMLSDGLDITADVLKVPHHGSAYSDAKFLAAVHARVAVISVGLHNDFGHPSPVLLARLGQLGLPVRRTDRDGDVAVGADANGDIRAVTRGTAASTVGLGAEVAGSNPPSHTSASRASVVISGANPLGHVAARRPAEHATMSAWQYTLSKASASTARCRRSSSWLATKTSSSPVPSSRSPPWRAALTPRSTFENVRERS